MLTPIPTEITFKQKFIDRYTQLTDWNAFKTYSLSFLRRSIRVNTLKIQVPDLVKRLSNWTLTPIPWCKEGFWITGKRRDEGNLIEHQLGYIYIQEAASMLPPLILKPTPQDNVLDLCAAPGSKTTQLAMYMNNQGSLLANDVSGKRLAALGMNLQRMGIQNTAITQYHGQNFPTRQFDKILVDAPCTGTGTIRKSLKTITIWNPNMIKKFSIMQKKLITHAYTLLKPGGTMVYSTCSLEPEENEAVIHHLLATTAARTLPIKLPLNHGKPITKFEGTTYEDVQHCLRLWPQDNDTEGFFVTKLTKP